jgi:ABC-type polysaccharide/polyol phosphate transport system ATPase subunit
MATPAIHAENIGIRFYVQHQRQSLHSPLVRLLRREQKPKEFWAFRNVDFEIPQGSVTGIIGSNGSGKSTLLRTLAGIFVPDEGELEVRGRVSALITLGAGFQLNLSGLDNVFYNGMLLGLTRQQVKERLDQIVDFADLGTFIDAPVRTYSSGMRARLGFAVAVHVDPEILVVDEVIAVGDAKFRNKCQAKFEEFFEKGLTVVMVQHNLEAILQMCHDCIWLERGQMRNRGNPKAIVDEYLASQGLPPVDTQEGAWAAGFETPGSTGPPLETPETLPAAFEAPGV